MDKFENYFIPQKLNKQANKMINRKVKQKHDILRHQLFRQIKIFRSPKKSIRYEQHGSILRHVVLKGVSAQMRSAAVSCSHS